MTAPNRSLTGVLDAYLDISQNQVRNLALSLTRMRSRKGRDVLAWMALPGRSAAELEESAFEYLNSSATAPHLAAFSEALRVPGALAYAFVTAAQNLATTDRDVARGLITAVINAHGRSALDRADAELLVQLALKARDYQMVERVLTTMPLRRGIRELVLTDAANPWTRPGSDEDTWLDLFNANLYGGELLPVTLLPDGDTPFDRLTAGRNQPVRHEYRITVIMSCYNPDRHLLTAVRSVLEQTWQNFELLVVDDASTAPVAGVLEKVERMDSRVRVIRKVCNGGTYRARNTALRQATGDFFTCVDSDDWAHPQRLELSVEPLLKDPGLIATRGSGVRSSTDLEFSLVGRGGRIVASSSLMVRTFPGLNRLGFFDPVRKGADNEYARRLEAAFGGAVVDLPRHALTLLLDDDASLSASDFSMGWRHPARSEYGESQTHFHSAIESGRSPAFLDPFDSRLFPAPRRWERYPQDGDSPGPLDVCVIADWRAGCLEPSTVDYVQRAAADGVTVGVVHVESLHDLRPTYDPVDQTLRELIMAGEVERVYLDDDRETSRVVVADPRPFQFPGESTVRLRTARLDVRSMPTAEHARHYDPTATGDYLAEVFGIMPTWTPTLPTVGVGQPD